LTSMVKDAERLSSNLLRMSNDKIEDKRKDVSVATTFPYIVTEKVFPSRMIIPLQDSLTCTLPSSSDTVYSHFPFPYQPVYIKGESRKVSRLADSQGIEDRVDVMPSLQRPKKIVFTGSDGSKYPFLCKPHDDLRKDARLMDFNAMINKLLKSASESRRRQLCKRLIFDDPLISRYPNLRRDASE
jgi:serine/threonine-protein kinase ATR